MKELNGDTLQSYFYNKATEKTRIRNITIDGKPATVIFAEYEAPAELIPQFREQNGTDGHYYYITFFVWSGHKSYYTGKDISIAYTYETTKEEGNAIYKQIKTTKQFTLEADGESRRK